MSEVDLICTECGYDLRGHWGDTRRCPECGTENCITIPRKPKPIRRFWLTALIIPTLIGVTTMVGFRIVLASNGLRVMDLWYNAHPRSGLIKAGRVYFAVIGTELSIFCFVVAVITLLYSIVLLITGCVRRDGRVIGVSASCFAGSLLFGLLALQQGFIIAGI